MYRQREPLHNKKLDIDTGRLRPKKRVYTVWLVSNNEDKWQMYYCPDCPNRTPIAQYKGEIIAEAPGEAPRPYPVKIQCKNQDCGRKIIFNYATEQVI